MFREAELRTALEEEIRSIIKQEISRLAEGTVGPEEIPDDLLLFDVNEDGAQNLGLDSLDALEIVIAIEDQQGIAVPEDVDFKQLATVNDIVAYVLQTRGTANR